MEKHFTTLETDFTLETLLPWRKETFILKTLQVALHVKGVKKMMFSSCFT